MGARGDGVGLPLRGRDRGRKDLDVQPALVTFGCLVAGGDELRRALGDRPNHHGRVAVDDELLLDDGHRGIGGHEVDLGTHRWSSAEVIDFPIGLCDEDGRLSLDQRQEPRVALEVDSVDGQLSDLDFEGGFEFQVLGHDLGRAFGQGDGDPILVDHEHIGVRRRPCRGHVGVRFEVRVDAEAPQADGLAGIGVSAILPAGIPLGVDGDPDDFRGFLSAGPADAAFSPGPAFAARSTGASDASGTSLASGAPIAPRAATSTLAAVPPGTARAAGGTAPTGPTRLVGVVSTAGAHGESEGQKRGEEPHASTHRAPPVHFGSRIEDLGRGGAVHLKRSESSDDGVTSRPGVDGRGGVGPAGASVAAPC